MQKNLTSDLLPSPQAVEGNPVSDQDFNQEDLPGLDSLEPTFMPAGGLEPTAVVPLPELGLATQSVPQEDDWAEFLSPLPVETVEIILTHLQSSDLYKVSHVNRLANSLACKIHLHRLQHALSQSVLWQHLPNIAHDSLGFGGVSFRAFLNTFQGPRNFRSEIFSPFFLMYQKRGNLPLNWNGIPVRDVKAFQECASKILTECSVNYSKPPQSLDDLMSGCSSRLTVRQQRKLWQAYYTVESLLSTMVLFLETPLLKQWFLHRRLHVEIRGFNSPAEFFAISREGRFLTGFGLITLEKSLPGILKDLIKEALRLREIRQKSDRETAYFIRLEILLDRLTEDNLLEYLKEIENATPHSEGLLGRHRQLVSDVMSSDYGLLLKKFTLTVIRKIDPNVFNGQIHVDKYKIIPKILGSRVLLHNLGQDGILTLLLRSPMSLKRQVLVEYPQLRPHLTVQFIAQWVTQESEENRAFCVVILLSDEALLSRFENHQIVEIAQFLGGEVLEQLMNTPAFHRRLRRENNRNPKPAITLLMQLAVIGDIELIDMVLKSPFFAPMLKPEEKILLEERIKNPDQTQSRFEKIDLAESEVERAADRVEETELLTSAEEQELRRARTFARQASQQPSHHAVHQLKSMAHQYQNKSSLVWQALGFALLGLALAITGVLTLAVSVGAFSLGFFAPPAVAGALGGIELIGSGFATLGVAATAICESVDVNSLAIP